MRKEAIREREKKTLKKEKLRKLYCHFVCGDGFSFRDEKFFCFCFNRLRFVFCAVQVVSMPCNDKHTKKQNRYAFRESLRFCIVIVSFIVQYTNSILK